MRVLFLFLLLANLAFFAWARYLAPPDPYADPRPHTREIAPERLVILPPLAKGAAAPQGNGALPPVGQAPGR
ncbi:MAG: hypothetical protein WCA09_01975 [Burkholderiales bacterium]